MDGRKMGSNLEQLGMMFRRIGYVQNVALAKKILI
jgi:hypothetical protein